MRLQHYSLFSTRINARKTIVFLSFLWCLSTATAFAQRWMENLGRGVVVTKTSNNTAFVSWRLLGTEPNTIGFNVYRKTGTAAAVKLNASPMTGGTNFEDKTGNFSQANSYYVTTVNNGTEGAPSASFTLAANTPSQPFYDVPLLDVPNYTVNYIWTGDLDGDGEMDFVFDRQPISASATILVEAYTGKGKFLWRLDCGPNSLGRDNISPASAAINIGHGDGVAVYDMNNDGKAEVMVRTASGVKFADGTVIQNSNNNVQFISVIDGVTGKEINRAQVPNSTLSVGPFNGHFGIAYLDGVNPSIYFSGKNRNPNKSFNMEVSAWTWRNGGLVKNWTWVRNNQPCPDGHNIRALDIDGDGKDEIIPFGYALDDDGKLLYSLERTGGVVHGDRFHITDMDPNRPGLEGYAIQQDNGSGLAWVYFDAKTGAILQRQVQRNPDGTPMIADLARGFAGDLDPRHKGWEFWTFTDGIYNVNGTRISNGIPPSYANIRFWWDGDLLSENLDNFKFTKWNYSNSTEGRIYTAGGVIQTYRKTPGLVADVVGDWREEPVYVRSDNRALRVYTTPIPTNTRIYTLLHNSAYRNGLTNKGYIQGAHPDFYLGDGMSTPPMPNIKVTNGNPQNILPTVSITAPTVNSIYDVPASITITANAADVDGNVARVEFYNGATLLGSDATSPYSYTWSNVAGGTYTLTARAYDDDGASAVSSGISITVNTPNPRPSVTITSPLDGTAIKGVPATVTINAAATDANGTITKVDFYNGTTLLGSDNLAPYSFVWANVGLGDYSIRAIATDNGNATDTASVSISVEDVARDCNGTAGGTAVQDKCGRCVGGTTNRTACATIVEAESSCRFNGKVDVLHDGYTGDGFVDIDNGDGMSITFAVTSTEAAKSTVSIRYANGSARGTRLGLLSVNGKVQADTLKFPVTGTWEEWGTADIDVTLLQGNNILSIATAPASSLPNLDQINLVSSSLSSGYCDVTGLNDKEMGQGILLYPNPSTQGFNIQLSETAEVKVYSLQGAIMEDLGLISFAQFGKEYSAGVYFVHVKDAELRKIYKVVSK